MHKTTKLVRGQWRLSGMKECRRATSVSALTSVLPLLLGVFHTLSKGNNEFMLNWTKMSFAHYFGCY